jgi:ribulose-5-phosphate 4-epimerase/fuculose-1-phosphate aldolase
MLMTLSEFCREVSNKNLVQASSGNASVRQENLFKITQSGVWFKDVEFECYNFHEDKVVTNCSINDNSVEGINPSSEALMHKLIYQARPDVNVVLHCQSIYATTLAYNHSLYFNVIPEVPYYIGEVGWVPCLKPGSMELADAVVEEIETHYVLQLINHGQVIVGESFDEVLQRAIFFELACQIVVNRSKIS